VAQLAQPRTASTAIVLHEDKRLRFLFFFLWLFGSETASRYYEEAEQVFGAGTEALVQDEDTTLLSDPTIKPPPKNTSLVSCLLFFWFSTHYLIQVRQEELFSFVLF
jgi:hypothetical protein